MQYCTFVLEDRLYGVDVLKVQEVVRHYDTTRVPLAPEVMRGLMNLRGHIVTTIDMRRRLGIPPLEETASTINIITQTSGGLMSLLVDQIGAVVELDEAESEPLPATVQGQARQFTTRVYKLKDRLLQILDPEKIAVVESRDTREARW